MARLLRRIARRVKGMVGRAIPVDHRRPYRLSYLRGLKLRALRQVRPAEYDVVFVIFEGNRGWILEAICKEIARYHSGRCAFYYSVEALPPARAYFISHYSLLPECLKLNPELWSRTLIVFHTHPSHRESEDAEIVYALNQATKVICMCSQFVRLLVSQGLPARKVTFILPGADGAFFRPHARASGAVGFSTAYYPRKSPDRILELVQRMPHRRFLLLGRRWREYERFEALAALPNFTYVETPYAEYPRYYDEVDVFVSAARLEGGPIPLIETMMCNAVPVASSTGFAPDVIRHGENGFLFDVDSDPDTICDLIEKAFVLDADVRKTVEHLTWRAFSLALQRWL